MTEPTKREGEYITTTTAQTPKAPEAEPAKATPEPAKADPAPKAEPAKTEPAQAVGEGPKRARLSPDGEIPDDADLLELSRSALDKRLARHSRKELQEHFGTSDVGEIKKKLDRLGELEKAEEERAKAAMTEIERTKAEMAAEQSKRQELERKVAVMQEKKVVKREEGKITQIVGKHADIADKGDRDYVFKQLARHLRKDFTEEQLQALSKDPAKYEKTINRWAKEFVARKPKFAKEPPVKTEKLSNGVTETDPPKADNKADMNDGKSFAPGRPNSMTREQAKAAAKKLGISW